jgi:hypothetical protein
MSIVYGNRTIWHGSEVDYWELRRGYTLPNYTSKTFVRLLDNVNEAVDRRKTLNDTEKRRLLFEMIDILYDGSCLKFFNFRFEAYLKSLPAPAYRRTSINFDMTVNNSFRIGAYTHKQKPDTIFINQGTILALEDVCHAILSFWTQPLGIDIDGGDPKFFPIRMKTKNLSDCFLEYRKNPSIYEDEDIRKLASYYPNSIIDSFLCVSADEDRQKVADGLSTMAMIWVISHEDAHRYSGHLDHFLQIGMTEQDKIFEELISTENDPELVRRRRSAEMEADMNATMRSVDYFFDNEFLAIFTDWVSVDLKKQIYGGNRRSAELTFHQRIFLMRLISISTIIPLILFDLAVNSTTYNNTANYPSILTRMLNIIFTVGSRAIDVSVNQPHYKVGIINLTDIYLFFQLAIDDIFAVYSIVQSCANQNSSNAKELFEGLRNIAPTLYVSFLACHDQTKRLGLRDRYTHLDFSNGGQAVLEFLVERQAMYKSIVDVFYKSKRIVNATRIGKVDEDIEIAIRRLKMSKAAFAFL